MRGIVAFLMWEGPEAALMVINASALFIRPSQWSHSTGIILSIVIACIVLEQLHRPYLV